MRRKLILRFFWKKMIFQFWKKNKILRIWWNFFFCGFAKKNHVILAGNIFQRLWREKVILQFLVKTCDLHFCRKRWIVVFTVKINFWFLARKCHLWFFTESYSAVSVGQQFYYFRVKNVISLFWWENNFCDFDGNFVFCGFGGKKIIL